uniref:ATP synthase subunit 8 n=1 Tax=Didymium iridis TaxID=5793 RepID=D2K6J7_9MYCE|nr:ATP synthase subunit 8 [Didymium iridis]ACZ96459.1 ATP synthase subunit 8 [Didymium iridis]
MPQFDTFIFSSSLFYFIISFFTLLYFNFAHYLPSISSLLKLRYKLVRKSSSTTTKKLSVNHSGIFFTKIADSYISN